MYRYRIYFPCQQKTIKKQTTTKILTSIFPAVALFSELKVFLSFLKGKRKKALTNITMLASTTLSKAAFLCSVLLEEQDTWHLAFQMGMFVLEMPRPPASCKSMEVSKLLQWLKMVVLVSMCGEIR